MTIKPGPELDQAVAEAVNPWCSVGMCASSGCIDLPVSQVGDTVETDPDVLAVWKWNGRREWRTLPKFSTDLNAAFKAAQETFGQNGFRVYCDDKHSWCEHWKRPGDPNSLIHGEASTPALAICAALLKLKEA